MWGEASCCPLPSSPGTFPLPIFSSVPNAKAPRCPLPEVSLMLKCKKFHEMLPFSFPEQSSDRPVPCGEENLKPVADFPLVTQAERPGTCSLAVPRRGGGGVFRGPGTGVRSAPRAAQLGRRTSGCALHEVWAAPADPPAPSLSPFHLFRVPIASPLPDPPPLPPPDPPSSHPSPQLKLWLPPPTPGSALDR